MILLINPRSARNNHRAPLSLLSVASGLEGRIPYRIFDENLDDFRTLPALVELHGIRYAGLTVMPGPQLTNAIKISRFLRKKFPEIKIIWGGSFPSVYLETVIESPLVDFVVWSQGECALPELIGVLEGGGAPRKVKGISWKSRHGPVKNEAREWVHPDALPPLPYRSVPMKRYLQRTYLGERTTGYVSSLGCPFFCGFCSVVPMFGGKWLAQSPERLIGELLRLRNDYGVDSIEFFDDNFFVSEKRTAEICDRLKSMKMSWWAEGRIDTLLKYSDATLGAMHEAGCRMIFSGAETGSDEVLNLMNKGGTQSGDSIRSFARRMKDYSIIPELSFILGNPGDNIGQKIDEDIGFIRSIKQINPESEIVFHTYSPVLLPGAKIYEEARRFGFEFPQKLEDWADPRWEDNGARKSSFTPWLKPRHRRKIRNFEIVLSAYAPSVADVKITPWRRRILKFLGGWRYRLQMYFSPYEIRLVLYKIFKYRQPQIEGAEQYPA